MGTVKRYQVITYAADTGMDERMEYRTQADAKRALSQYREEECAIIYDLRRRRIIYQRGYCPSSSFPQYGN